MCVNNLPSGTIHRGTEIHMSTKKPTYSVNNLSPPPPHFWVNLHTSPPLGYSIHNPRYLCHQSSLWANPHRNQDGHVNTTYKISTKGTSSKKDKRISFSEDVWWSLHTLYLFACQVELPQAIQVFVVVSPVC